MNQIIQKIDKYPNNIIWNEHYNVCIMNDSIIFNLSWYFYFSILYILLIYLDFECYIIFVNILKVITY